LIHYGLKFLLTLLWCTTVCTLCFSENQPDHTTLAKKGILDLREIDFNEQTINLDGEWKFFWDNLLQPDDPEPYFEYKSFPDFWHNMQWHQKQISSQGYATYKLTLLLPKKRPRLSVAVPEMYCAYYLFVNGEKTVASGKPDTTKASTIPYWSSQVVPLHSHTDTLHITLQVANFHHVKGGVAKEIKIGSHYKLQSSDKLDHAFDYFLTGCIIMGGFFFLGLYLFGRHDKSILYFALFCIFYSYRIIGSGQYSLQAVLPDISWTISIHLEYLSLFLAVAMFALYTRYLYPEDAPQKLLSIMAGICFAFALVTLLSPPILFTRLIDPFIFLVLIYIAFAIVIYWKAYRNRRIGAQYALMSSVAIFIIIICVILEYYSIAPPFHFVLFTGYVIFFFCQSLILTFRFAYTLKKAKEDAELGLKTKGEFLSTMSHEIRTPLNSVIGMTHLMIRENPRDDQKEQLDVLLFSANNLLNIVNDVLDFSTIEAGKIRFSLEAMDMKVISRNIVSGYKAAANTDKIRFVLDLDEKVPQQIRGDKTRTTQIIGNLVHNAIKFTNEGYVKLSVRIMERTMDEVTLKIAVEDTGIGIAPEKQKLVFERFTQADSSSSRGFSGTGLGLSISKKILELQGIELHLESEPGKGSTFSFIQKFQILEDRVPEPPVEPSHQHPLSGVNILIVEDNAMNVLVLRNFLTRWGASFDVAHNGEEALELLTSSHQIILMDMHMPVMDGYEATKALRTKGETVPIIALTASLALNAEEHIISIGINDIVLKPFAPDQLLEVILKHTRSQRV
jgi:signal transduction histidine kinase